MSRRQLRRYLRQNPDLKKWLKANGEWFKTNPQAMRSLLDNPSFLNAFNHALLSKRNRLTRRIKRLEANRITPPKGKTRSLRLKLPSLADLNQRLAQTSEIVEGIQTMMKKEDK